MATMISEVYDALRDAQGVTEEKARKAAEAVAAFDQRFIAIEKRLDETKASLELKLEQVKGSQRVQQWMLGTIVAGVAAVLVRILA